MKRMLICILAIVSLTVSCKNLQEPVHVASKDFGESRILAEMIAALALEAGVPVRRSIPYGNTFSLQEAIKEGRVDIYPEYTGTGLSMMGIPAMSDEDQAMQTVRGLFSSYGIEWQERLGFNNSFVVAMHPALATQKGIESIGGLAALQEKVTIGCEEEFYVRPVDGYQPMVRRYGFTVQPEARLVNKKQELYRDLISERTDAIVVQATDPRIEEFNLTVLKDDLDFFPAYEGAPLVRREVLARFPALKDALSGLAGLLDNETLRTLNRRVELDGVDPRVVAVEFLVAKGLVERRPPESGLKEMVVALPPREARSSILAGALEAMRQVFKNRRVVVRSFDSPAQALIRGEALISVLGAEHFFSVNPGQLPIVRDDIEAIVPVGFRMVHLIRPEKEISSMPFENITRLGAGPENGSGERMARILLDSYGRSDSVEIVYGSPGEQAAALAEGDLDALLIVDVQGSARMMLMFHEYPSLTLQPLAKWNSRGRQYRYPFLRLSRVSKDVYPGVEKAVDSVSSQVVIAGPRPEALSLGDGDPVSGLSKRRQAIPEGVKKDLASAIANPEPLDPALPGTGVGDLTARREVKPLNPSPEASVLTAGFFIALAGFLYLLQKSSGQQGSDSVSGTKQGHHARK